MKATFVELPPFERIRKDYMDDDAYRELQQALMDNPEAGDVIERTGSSPVPRKANTMTKKRDIFAELSEGFEALQKQREGKLTLRTFKAASKPAPTLSAQDVVSVREQLHLSRPVFARYLRTNPRTLENWEQGRAKPNAQAALLIRMVAQFPDMVQRLEAV